MSIIHLNAEYVPMANDLIKFTVMFVVINILMALLDSSNRLFSAMYLKVVAFALLGIATYWLVVRKIVVFEDTQENQ